MGEAPADIPSVLSSAAAAALVGAAVVVEEPFSKGCVCVSGCLFLAARAA